MSGTLSKSDLQSLRDDDSASEHVTPQSNDDYRIGIICALSVELAAVRAMLDIEYGRLQQYDNLDHNVYYGGRMIKHNVVIACLPAGNDGTSAAAYVASNMLHTFRHLRFGLLVGIGGGIPNLTTGYDIRLGDVVVSQPQGIHGGIVQYDKGKRTAGGGWERKGAINMPPSALLTALQSVKSDYELGEGRMNTYMEEMLQRRPLMSDLGYAFPGVDKDIFYCYPNKAIPSTMPQELSKSPQLDLDLDQTCHEQCRLDATSSMRAENEAESYALTARPVKRQKTSTRNDNNGSYEYSHKPEVVARKVRTSSQPQVHYGTIASGNSVIKNAFERDSLRDQFAAICVEMEAAGLMNEFPCLVIRGICDYADEQKNDDWHRYASCTAAAFAKELLNHVSSCETVESKPIIDLLGNLDQNFQIHLKQQQAQTQQRDLREEAEKHQACHQVFKTCEYEYFKNINCDAAKGTCRWVFEHDKFFNWCTNPSQSLLWISADPGCGKSVLSKALVDSLLRRGTYLNCPTQDDSATQGSLFVPFPNQTVCYFFFKDNELQDSLTMALCSIIHQLFSQQPQLVQHAMLPFAESGDKLQGEKDELWRILYDAIDDTIEQPVICVIDALDECRDSDRNYFIDLLRQSYRHSSRRSRIKWLVTSRPYGDIEHHFENVCIGEDTIRLRGEDQNDRIREEIDLVINQRMIEVQHELHLSDEKVKSITDRLYGMSNRTYLWLHLVIDEIKCSFRYSLRPEREMLNELPQTVEEVYEKILQRANQREGQRQRVKTILSIVVGARRPLSAEEMSIALDLSTRSKPPTSLTDLDIDAEHLKRNIRAWCGLFVFWNHNRIFLIHQTAKEFLLKSTQDSTSSSSWKRCLQPKFVELEMAKICVRFLSLREMEIDSASAYPARLKHVEGYSLSGNESFLLYAARHWAGHVRLVQSVIDDATKSQLLAMYTEMKLMFLLFLRPDGTRDEFDMRYEVPVHAAVINQHETILDRLLKSGEDWMYCDEHGRHAIAFAAYVGNLRIVRMLMDAGADGASLCHFRYSYYQNEQDYAIHIAARRGFTEIVNLLIERGALVDCQTALDGSPLQSASESGHVQVVQALLDHGANVNLRAGRHVTALKSASSRNHKHVVRLLLAHGATVDDEEGSYATSLHEAVANNDEALVEELIVKGAALDAADDNEGPPLTLAVFKGHTAIVRKLLDHGADPNWRDDFGSVKFIYSALYYAAREGHDDIVKMLLDAGAAQEEQVDGESPMSLALRYGNSTVFRMLLAKDVAKYPDPRYYGFLLHIAVENDDHQIVDLLLDHKAEVNEYVPGKDTILQTAAHVGNPYIVQQLLEHGAEVNETGGYYGSALQTAIQMNHRDVIELLLQWGAIE